MGKLSARMAIYPFSVTVFGVGGFVGYAVFGNSGLAHLLRGCLLALTGVVNSLAFFLLDPSAGTMARQALSVSPDSLNRLVPLKRLLMWMAGVSASDVSMPTSSEASRVPPSSMS
ncbi:hypothetical protein M427DRAFT_158315 [Gonapodya prolifera JEL478]|uniref:Uncharacterized protein n=1 Tax=Gonapodya prolifera (strain JEL478) TaxID=1344416 RepID=A0A139A3A1_GONPJ|nr:hypothetical protein M427DRAFT_158315 [Gonapodya prolifera JEL478]|eukprot:KXS11272.1 hypothetical protein M427DRAFT_158315 [Gonapodya prolifera JEL478]